MRITLTLPLQSVVQVLYDPCCLRTISVPVVSFGLFSDPFRNQRQSPFPDFLTGVPVCYLALNSRPYKGVNSGVNSNNPSSGARTNLSKPSPTQLSPYKRSSIMHRRGKECTVERWGYDAIDDGGGRLLVGVDFCGNRVSKRITGK